jgi:hypothetical protein
MQPNNERRLVFNGLNPLSDTALLAQDGFEIQPSKH